MQTFGWRHALEIVGLLIVVVLLPVGIWITRSTPVEMGLLPDGVEGNGLPEEKSSTPVAPSSGVGDAVRTANFWLILTGSTLGMGAIGAVIPHFILFLKDQGYTATTATRFSTALLAASLGRRVLAGYLADRFRKRNTMALSYLLLAGSILFLCMAYHPATVCSLAVA